MYKVPAFTEDKYERSDEKFFGTSIVDTLLLKTADRYFKDGYTTDDITVEHTYEAYQAESAYTDDIRISELIPLSVAAEMTFSDFDVHGFFKMKFLQLIKYIKSEEEITPDVIHELLISLMARDCNENEVILIPDVIKEWGVRLLGGELLKMAAKGELYIETEDAVYAKVRNAVSNLHSLVELDMDIEYGFLFLNYDFTDLCNELEYRYPFFQTLVNMALDRQMYGLKYVNELFESVGYEFPEKIREMIKKVSKSVDEDTKQRIEDTLEVHDSVYKKYGVKLGVMKSEGEPRLVVVSEAQEETEYCMMYISYNQEKEEIEVDGLTIEGFKTESIPIVKALKEIEERYNKTGMFASPIENSVGEMICFADMRNNLVYAFDEDEDAFYECGTIRV